MQMQCLVERAGDSVATIGTYKYVFKENEYGHKVCEVGPKDHREHMMHNSWFVEYDPIKHQAVPKEVVEQEPPEKVYKEPGITRENRAPVKKIRHTGLPDTTDQTGTTVGERPDLRRQDPGEFELSPFSDDRF